MTVLIARTWNNGIVVRRRNKKTSRFLSGRFWKPSVPQYWSRDANLRSAEALPEPFLFLKIDWYKQRIVHKRRYTGFPVFSWFCNRAWGHFHKQGIALSPHNQKHSSMEPTGGGVVYKAKWNPHYGLNGKSVVSVLFQNPSRSYYLFGGLSWAW